MFDFIYFLMLFFLYLDNIGFFFLLDFFFSFCLFLFSLVFYFLMKLLSNDRISWLLSIMLSLISFNFFFCWSMINFIVFFELSSMMVIIMALIFGIQVEKINSFYFFFFYNLISFLPFFFLMIYFMKSMIILNLIFLNFFMDYFYMFFSLLVFFVKFPLFFFHFWLPKIHVEASTFSSMLLASLLLKFGVFGLYRFLFLLKYNFFLVFFYIFFFGLIISLLICLSQSDLKSQIAYSSVSHMSVVFFNLIIFSSIMEKYSFLVTLGHAFSSCLSFWLVGEIFYSCQSRLVMEVNSFFLSNNKFSFLFTLMLMLLGSFPFSLSYFTEFYMIYIFSKNFFFMWFFIWFFFFDLFFVMFLMTLIYFGKKYKKVNSMMYMNLSLLIFWSYNFFFYL
uniref:NADH-ubiquinone oxidoreductase chain 4 n=1 Tax=Meloidogyne incognita TaxID=6306 RepID=A0A023VV43_MELIC|nr:NADH dehydrogenase subunit 4 [Meloidogyne incognita]AHY20107.1 NADH dehydrogenase subunit 4 [Meloidogyne incognita]